MGDAFFAAIRPQFGGALKQSQVDGLNRLLAATAGLPIQHRAYILATAQHETAHTMQPVRETLASSDAQAIARLDAAWARKRLPWVKAPYWRRDAQGKAWFGRGYVQLTHKANYAKAGERLGIDLVSDPSVALRPDIAATILVRGMLEGWFTGRKLGDYTVYEAMRLVVNGTDRAGSIADLARAYEKALRAQETAPAPKPAADKAARAIPALAAIAVLILLILLFAGH